MVKKVYMYRTDAAVSIGGFVTDKDKDFVSKWWQGEFDDDDSIEIDFEHFNVDVFTDLLPDLKPGECARVVGLILEKDGEGNG